MTARFATTCLSLLLLSSCASEPPKQAEQQPPPEPVTGIHALAQMFSAARTWQPDVQVFRVSNINIDAVKPQPGKAGAWQATFVSPSHLQSRVYTFSVVDASTSLRLGIFPDPPASYSPSSQAAQTFPITAVKKDTDEIYQVAMEHAAKYIKSHPDQPMNYLLELTSRSPNAAWRVFWGSSVSSSGFSVLVDATTGKFVKVVE
jgi:hypothetical protein